MTLAQARTHHRVKSASRYAAYASRPARMYTDCAPGGVGCAAEIFHTGQTTVWVCLAPLVARVSI